MIDLNLHKIPKTHFVFDYVLPNGYLPFGYNKHTFPINVMEIFKNVSLNQIDILGYYSSIGKPNDFIEQRVSDFTQSIINTTPNTDLKTTFDIHENINTNDLYLVVFETLKLNNMFQTYSDDLFSIDNMVSPKLLELIKKYPNVKIIFMDIWEGAYEHFFDFFEKIHEFLKKHKINHKNKVIVSTNNNFIEKVKENPKFKQFNDSINVYSNNFLLMSAGKFLLQLEIQENSIIENDYTFSVQQSIHFDKREKYFLMYNRNPERFHRPYFINKLYKGGLLDKGFVSLFENEEFENFIKDGHPYKELELETEDFKDIKKNLKHFYPLVIDEGDSQRVADFHNFLSRKDEYEKSFFSIVAETNAESDFNFITEKTLKPILNLHPFLILGNPKTLSVLKSYGFKTFDKWWDESYDDEFNFKNRASKLYKVVDDLCNKSQDEWIDMLREMEDVLKHNQKNIKKLYTKKMFQKEFFSNLEITNIL